jgi:enamine deaminase RidA (YjgF/YER057c/UK114 family)
MAPPVAKYAHAVKVDKADSFLFTSGVVPTMSDGTVPPSIEGQARVVWANLLELLGDHRAASALVTVPALARAEWLMEISLIAAQ